MVLVIIGWVMFRAASMHDAMTMFGGMVGLNGWGISPAFAWHITSDRLVMLAIAAPLVYLAPQVRRIGRTAFGYLLIPLFLWAVATLSSQSFIPFLYFQF